MRVVAISPAVGIQRMRRVGERHTHPELLRGDFADGAVTVLGEDCIELTLTLLELTARTARIESRFSPPRRACLDFREPWMATRAGAASNFQMIRAPSDDVFDVLWGTEWFTIVAELQRSDGKLLRATMDNVLDLQMRAGCDAGLAGCKGRHC